MQNTALDFEKILKKAVTIGKFEKALSYASDRRLMR